ncbi:MAG: hypothetical protein ABI459_09845 [Deltaproteobacteria bacterium]
MGNGRKILAVLAVGVVAVVAMVGGTWYKTTALEEIDPKGGLYSMAGLELWIDLNARMPTPLRVWACDTLLEREKIATGSTNRVRPPYGCQPDFGTVDTRSFYEVTVDANLAQVIAGTNETQSKAIKDCFGAKIATLISQDDIATANGDPASDAMQRAILAISATASACKAEVAP